MKTQRRNALKLKKYAHEECAKKGQFLKKKK